MILVTGGTGLVGAHLLVDLLSSGESVRALYRNSSSITPVKNVFRYYGKEDLFDKVDWICCDLTDVPGLEEAMEGISIVYHAAALVAFDPSRYEEIVKTNVEGTANIVNCALDAGVKKLAFVSSVAALGHTPDGSFIDEETPWKYDKTRSDYSLSKYNAEREVWRAHMEGLDVFIVNPGIILGPSPSTGGSMAMFEQLKKGGRFYTDGTTGYVDVRDVSAMLISLVNMGPANERFVLVSENLSYKDVFYKIADALEVKRPSIEVKPWLSAVGWRLNRFLSWFGMPVKYTRFMARSAHDQVRFNADKAKQKFSFRTIDEAIKNTALFLQEQGREKH